MKKLVFLYMLSNLASFLFGQDPGVGFEKWETHSDYFLSNQWNLYQVKRTTDAYKGNYAAEINQVLEYGGTSSRYSADPIPLPIAAKPDSLIFWYKNNSLSNGENYVSCKLFSHGGVSIASFSKIFSPSLNWTRFATKISYTSSDTMSLRLNLYFGSGIIMDELTIKNKNSEILKEGMENWKLFNYELPTGSSLLGSNGVKFPEKTDESWNGNYAMSLKKYRDSLFNYPSGYETFYNIQQKPNKFLLSMRIKSKNETTDSLELFAELYDSAFGLVSNIKGYLSAKSSLYFKHFEVPIDYRNQNPPKYARIGLYQHADRSKQMNNDSIEFILDDVMYDNQSLTVMNIAHDALLNCYPNPSIGKLTINLGGAERGQNLAYAILNSSGQIVINGGLIESVRQVDVSNLDNGLYFIQLIDETTLYRHPFVLKK